MMLPTQSPIPAIARRNISAVPAPRTTPATIAAVMPPMQKSTMAASTHGETRTGMGSDAVKPSS